MGWSLHHIQRIFRPQIGFHGVLVAMINYMLEMVIIRALGNGLDEIIVGRGNFQLAEQQFFKRFILARDGRIAGNTHIVEPAGNESRIVGRNDIECITSFIFRSVIREIELIMANFLGGAFTRQQPIDYEGSLKRGSCGSIWIWLLWRKTRLRQREHRYLRV